MLLVISHYSVDQSANRSLVRAPDKISYEWSEGQLYHRFPIYISLKLTTFFGETLVLILPSTNTNTFGLTTLVPAIRIFDASFLKCKHNQAKPLQIYSYFIILYTQGLTDIEK